MGGFLYNRFGKPTSGAPTSLIITASSLPNATVGGAYSAAVTVSGGSGSGYSIYIKQAVPNSNRWLQLTGALTLGGIPQAAEISQVTLVACDSAGNVSSPVTFSLTSVASGALAFVTGAALEPSTSNGIFCRPIIVQGGVPPYIHAAPDQVQPWAINWDGWLLGAPTATGSKSITDVVTDSAGASVSRLFTTTVGNGIGVSGLDLATNQINLPGGVSGNKYQYSFWPFGGIGSGYSCSVTAGALAPGLTLSTLKISGTPTRAGTFFATVRVSDGTNTASYSVCHQVVAADAATRPGYNTGTGLFVVNGKLYDSGGKVTFLRGINRTHYDSNSWASGANGGATGANIGRVFEIPGRSAAQVVTDCNTEYLSPSSGNAIIPIITHTSDLATAVVDWLSYFSSLSAVDSKIILNLANEWGSGGSSAAWTNGYAYVASSITGIAGSTVTVNSNAVTNPFANSPFCLIKSAGGITDVVLNVSSRGGSQGAWTVTFTAPPVGTYTSGGTLYGGAVGVMRGAGYRAPLLIDAGGAGQDYAGLIANAQTIQQSDPQQNCLFAFHAYGAAVNYECSIASVTKANPAVITLISNLPYHPFAPQYPNWSNNNFSEANYVISGAQGMTQLNGTQPTNTNHIGGSAGAWTITLAVDSTGWGTYTGGGTAVKPSDYRQIMAQLAALRANNVCVGIFEFGPGNAQGNHLVAFNGYTSGTTLTVTSMISGVILPGTIGIYGSAVDLLTSANGASPAVSTPTRIFSQAGGTPGGVGVYAFGDTPQTIGSAGSPVKLFVQNFYGNEFGWYGPATGVSPTDTSLGQIISACEANLLPWAYWALDDHDIGTNQETRWIGWFGMENALYTFAVPSDLTAAGMDVVFHPRCGLRTLASPASYLL